MKKSLSIMLLLLISTTSYSASEGDNVCVGGWKKGYHFCGTIDRVTEKRYKIEITKISCGSFGCSASSSCSGGRVIGDGLSYENGAVVGDAVWVDKWCTE